jgi:hypothetical protein
VLHIYNHVVSGQKKDEKRVLLLGHEPSGKASEMMVELSEGRAKKFGSDIFIASSGLDEECERELENERELEREAERQYARYAPHAPREWEFKELLKSEHPSELKALGIMPLHEAISKSFDPKLQLSQIEWQHSGIYVTQNFFETVLIKDLGSKLEDYGLYMRPVQWIVTFQSSKCCLLSEWEAENVLEILWKRPESKVRIVQMCYLREAADTKYEKGVRLALPQNLPDGNGCGVDEVTMAGLQLLAGETMFGPSGTENREAQIREARLAALAKLLPTREAKKAALSLPFLCDKHQHIKRSDLEMFCNLDIDDGKV